MQRARAPTILQTAVSMIVTKFTSLILGLFWIQHLMTYLLQQTHPAWTTFGSGPLKECIMQRRLEERQAPPDEHEEITWYLKDAIVDLSNWPSVFHWWKVLLCFTCKHHK